MKRNWFNPIVILLGALVAGLAMLPLAGQAEAYQDAPTPSGVVITVAYTDPMNGTRPVENIEITYASMTYQYYTKDSKGVRSGSMEETKWRVPDSQLFPYDAGCH